MSYILVNRYSGIKKIYEDDYLKLKDASKHFGFNLGYFLIWIEGELPAIINNNVTYVKVGDVIKFVKSGLA